MSADTDNVMKSIQQLTSDELLVKLISYNVPTGPITGTTRPLFERKLYRLMTGQKEETNTTQTTSTTPTAGSTKQKQESESTPPKENIFYGVQLPIEARSNGDVSVFTDKKEALRLVKLYPGSRFKAFHNRPKAVDFSRQNPDQVPPSPKPVKPDGKPVSEGSAFKGPKTQELVRLRKAIESGDKATVEALIWSNPRYMISSGDTPSVLQEGFRYNALHVCAQKNQPEICQYLINTLQDEEFIKLLYPDDTPETRKSRIHFLTDLYLNMPDKGNNETPLHFACKFAFPAVVKILVSHPQTDKSRKNRYHETPYQVVCQRARSITQELKNSIYDLLEDQCFVPLLRSDESSQIPTPWSPERITEVKDITTNNPTDSPLKVKAVAGPMSPNVAERFRRNWLTPPSPSLTDRKKYAEIRRSDYEKGLERIGRMLAKEMNIPWSEYWTFLDSFIDLTSKEGLKKLEDYLSEQSKKLESPISGLDHQFAALSLSDSGEDSGIENRELQTPPQPKRHKLPSLRSPLPNSLTLYTVKPSPPPSPNSPAVDSAKRTSFKDQNDHLFRMCDSPMGKALSQGFDSPSSKESSPLKSAETTLQNDSSLNLSSASNSLVLGNDAFGKVTNDTFNRNIQTHDNKMCSENNNKLQNENNVISMPLLDAKTNDLISLSTSSTTTTNDAHNKVQNTAHFIMDNNTKSKQVEAFGLDNIKPIDNYNQTTLGTYGYNETKMMLDGIDSSQHTRVRRHSDASTTSDFSTDSYHTCYEDVWSDEDRQMEAEDGEEEWEDVFGDTMEDTKLIQSPTLHRFFIHGLTPTKDDVDVLRALETTPVSPEDYPHVTKWRDALLSYSEEDRNKWSSPKRHLTPSRKTLPPQDSETDSVRAILSFVDA